jgi:hypothetical protein
MSDASDEFENASDNAGNNQQAWEVTVDIVDEGIPPDQPE